jgi:glycosyltransferase involved in cell wall biosynthesis
MPNEPLVSVVIPAYNAQRFIERTLASAIAQTHRNLEIIVIDDGSVDDTRTIVHRFVCKDDRIRILSIPNGGVAEARNVGIAEAAGDFVAFLDADDVWHPKKIQLQLASLTIGDGVGAAASYTFHRLIDVDDYVIGKSNETICNGYAFARLLYAKFVGNGSSLLVRRHAAVSVGGYEPTWALRGIGGCEDLDFELKIAAQYPIIATPYFLVGYRISPGNMSSDKLRMARAIIATVEHHITANSRLPKWAAAKARSSTREYALWLLLVDKHWDIIVRELFALFHDDAERAVAFAANLALLKARKPFMRVRSNNGVPRPFSSFSEACMCESLDTTNRRTVHDMERLAKLDKNAQTYAAPS